MWVQKDFTALWGRGIKPCVSHPHTDVSVKAEKHGICASTEVNRHLLDMASMLIQILCQ